MSITLFARGKGAHRALTIGELKTELDKAICAYTSLNGHFEELAAAYDALQTELTAARETLRRVDAERATFRRERDDAQAEVRRLQADNTGLRAQLLGRDTAAIEDQATQPMDLSDLQAELRPHIEPLIQVRPLFHAPLAAVTDPGHYTDEDTITLPVPRRAFAA